MIRYLLGAVLWIGIFVPFCSALPHQETAKAASLVIEVKDASGAVVSNATVQISSLLNLPVRRSAMDGDGKFAFDLSQGSYELTVESQGFTTVTRHIEVQEGSQQVVQIVMNVGECTQCVVVLGEQRPVGPSPVSFPAQSQAISPDGRYVLVSVYRKTERHHPVFLEDRARHSRRKLFNYDSHVSLLWQPNSKSLAVTDYIGSGHSTCRIISVDAKIAPIQITDALSQQISDDEWGRAKNELSEQHAYIEALGWGGSPVVLVVSISIDGYLERVYDVFLPTGSL